MATVEQTLSSQQKELVAVGASIGAGCHPCVNHHLQAAKEAGLDAEQLLAAAASAERVTAEAAVLIGDHVRGTLGPDIEPALLSRLNETLASLGAALGANDKTNIERQLKAAADLGVSREQLHEAIETARVVQENASRIHVRAAEGVLDSLDGPAPSPPGGSCGCTADQPADTAERTAAAEQVGATPTAGCDPAADTGTNGFAAMMATFSGPSDGSTEINVAADALARCRGMFERSPAANLAASPTAAPETQAPSHGCKKGAGR